MRVRQVLIPITTAFLAAALTTGIAEAQQRVPQGAPARSSSQFSLRREEAGGANVGIARQRARAGDCAGALPAFDSAIRLTIEPTLRRDRGLCHEKLGDPFPAIEDYRAYVTARPDAPDADSIRDRLARLEEQTGVGKPSAQSVKDREEGSGPAGGASFSLGTTDRSSTGASSSRGGVVRKNEALGPRNGEKERSYDYYAAQERIADAADASPLRFGTGWAIGAFLQLPRYFLVNGATSDLGAGIGATVRYSFSPSLTFIADVGYIEYGTTGQTRRVGGPLLSAGIEWRIPLDVWATNQLFVGIGPNFERYSTPQTTIGLNVLNARGKFGFRHVFGPAFGLELALDGGPGVAFTSGSIAGQSASSSSSIAVVNGTLGAVLGF